MYEGLVFTARLLVILGGGWALFWLVCRLTARRCPNCDSKWRTELIGEWDGVEDWHCHCCGVSWGFDIETETDSGWNFSDDSNRRGGQ